MFVSLGLSIVPSIFSSKPTLVKLCDRLGQFCSPSCAMCLKTASVLLLRRHFEHVPYPPGPGSVTDKHEYGNMEIWINAS